MIHLNRVIVIDDIYAYYRAWTTKEFFECKNNRIMFLYTEVWEYAELIENIKNGKVAVFPVSASVRMEEIVNTKRLGLQVYVVRHKEWKELRESYIKDCVEVHKK